MSFIDTIPTELASDELRDMYSRQQRSYGYVPGYARIFSHRPELMSLWANLLRGLKQSMEHRLFELATLAAALQLRSTNCSLAHASFLQAYYTDAELIQIVNGDAVSSGIITEAESALMNFARLIARDASVVTQVDVDSLFKAGYTSAEIFDIAAAAAGRAFFTKVVDGLGGKADHEYANLSQELKAVLQTGRPLEVGEQAGGMVSES